MEANNLKHTIMTKEQIINELAVFAGLTWAQSDLVQSHKRKLPKTLYDKCLADTMNDKNAKSMARFCLNLLCGIPFVDRTSNNN